MIDLHMHSMFSDGTFTPEELVAAGVRNGRQGHGA
jgi:histidinol phosphatase-like PHP family hydrolase